MDADDTALGAVVFELDRAGDLGEQRVVLAAPDVEAGIEAAAALADEDGAAGHDVAVEPLDAEALRIAVTPVARAALSLFMCHDELYELAEIDAGDAYAGERRAVPLGAAHALPALLL